MPSLETVIASTLGMPEATITDELSYQNGRWDSLNHIELMLALEQAFGVTIGAEDVERLGSVRAIREFLRLPDAQLARGSSRVIASEPTVHRGLDGVTFDRTTITKIDSQGGALLYRGYSVGELVSCSDFEEVAYLLLHGELPAPDELAELRHALRTQRRIPDDVIAILRGLVAAHPMDALRTAVSALATFDPDRHDSSPAATLRKGVRLIAQVPTIVATFHTLRQGDRPRMPREDLDPASDFMYQLFGGRPTQETRDALHADFILHADHGANASTFTARVVTGTGADVHAAVTAAIAAFAGPLHGGAVENVLAMAREIGHPSRAGDYVRACRAAGKPVMGFGHRIYKVEDPRARELLALAEHLAQSRGERLLLDTLLAVVEAMQPQASHGLVVNVDLYASVVYHLLGIPDDLSVPVFVVGRIAGWIAQVLEQQSANILIRPRLAYVGTPRRSYPR